MGAADTGVRQNQAFDIGRFVQEGTVIDGHMPQVDELQIVAVAQQLTVCTVNTVTFLCGHKGSGVGAQLDAAQLHGPDEPGAGMAPVQRLHVLVGDSAVHHIHLLQIVEQGKRGNQFRSIFKGNAGKVHKFRLRMHLHAAKREFPRKTDAGKRLFQCKQ